MNTEEIRKHIEEQSEVKSAVTYDTLVIRLLKQGYMLCPPEFSWDDVEEQ